MTDTSGDLPYSPTVLGVVNLSPESMVRDSIATTPEAVRARVASLADAGAAVFDVGGRSITPDAAPIDDEEEQRRLLPVLRQLADDGRRLSVDTWSAETAIAALSCGVELVNYTAEELPTPLLEAIASAGAGIVLTYMPYGDAYRMRNRPAVPYRLDTILTFLAPRIEAARAAGIRRIVVDPNLGIIHPDVDDFEKIHLQLDLLWRIDRVRDLGCPVMLYAARKPERLARIMMVSAVLLARPEVIRIHEPETIQRLLAAQRASQA